jgi:hypothetical protein
MVTKEDAEISSPRRHFVADDGAEVGEGFWLVGRGGKAIAQHIGDQWHIWQGEMPLTL